MRWPMLIASAALALAPTVALAHGGGVDANGCHTNKKTGDYHCHGGVRPSPSPSFAGPADFLLVGCVARAMSWPWAAQGGLHRKDAEGNITNAST